MNTTRACGCKGRRSCLICEAEYNIGPEWVVSEKMRENSFVYCPLCCRAWPGWNDDQIRCHPNHTGESISFPGVFVHDNFLDDTEQLKLCEGIEEEQWDCSQSGRRKQNYGPKCNFRKNKIQVGDFKGFPQFSQFVQEKFNKFDMLKNFYVIEQCSLEYDPVKGASIDPHIDDCWIWGERIITVNVLGNAVLTMTQFKGDSKKYNLNQVQSYPRVLDDTGKYSGTNFFESACDPDCVRIFMPEKSLLVLYGAARYQWEHCVLREDIPSRRVCLAYREFTPPYLPGGSHENLGKDILDISKRFWK